MDPDQDLLDRLDKREAGGPIYTLVLVVGLAGLAGILTYFTLTMELRSSTEIAGDAAALVFIVSATLLGIRRYRFGSPLCPCARSRPSSPEFGSSI